LFKGFRGTLAELVGYLVEAARVLQSLIADAFPQASSRFQAASEVRESPDVVRAPLWEPDAPEVVRAAALQVSRVPFAAARDGTALDARVHFAPEAGTESSVLPALTVVAWVERAAQEVPAVAVVPRAYWASPAAE
jgi:hypothetical protein